jgi:hypothetical protein
MSERVNAQPFAYTWNRLLVIMTSRLKFGLIMSG